MDFFQNRPDANRGHEPSAEMNSLTQAIIGACIEVHRVLGPRLNESMYELPLCYELGLRGIGYRRQAEVGVHYKGQAIGTTRLDLLVEGRVIVELKACDQLAEVHRAQLLTYLAVTHLEVGLLVNFNVPRLVDGVKRVVRTS